MLFRQLTASIIAITICLTGGIANATRGQDQQGQGDKKQDEKKQDDKKQEEKKQEDKEKAEKAAKARALASEGQQLIQQGDPAGAAKKFTEATELDPTFAQAWFMKGYALHMSGNLDEAIKAHAKAAEFPQFEGNARYNLACAYSLKKETDKALAELKKAVELNFTYAQIDEDTDFDNIRDNETFKELAKKIKGE